MKQLKYNLGQIEITLSVPNEDYEWVKLLFERNNKPFTALRDIGYDTQKDEDSYGKH